MYETLQCFFWFAEKGVRVYSLRKIVKVKNTFLIRGDYFYENIRNNFIETCFLYNNQNSSNHAKNKMKKLTTHWGVDVRTSIHWEKTSRSSDHSHLASFETLHTKGSSLCIGYLDINIKLLLMWQISLIIQVKNFSEKILPRRLRWSSSLTHSFPMHPFSTPWKHQKTARFSDVFRG